MPNGIGSRLKTGPSQTGQLPGRIKSELCDLSGLRIDLISRLLSLSRLYSGILHSLSLSLAPHLVAAEVLPRKEWSRKCGVYRQHLELGRSPSTLQMSAAACLLQKS